MRPDPDAPRTAAAAARADARFVTAPAAGLLAAALLAAPGCAPRTAGERGAAPGVAPDRRAAPATAEAAVAFARDADARRSGLDSARGRVTLGDSDARFTAWFEDGHVRAVRESVSFGDYGASVLDWYFAGDALVLVMERGTRVAAGPGAPAGSAPVEMRIAFGPGGDTLEARRALAGEPVAFHPGWLLGIRARAETLLARARGARASISRTPDTLLPHP
jgi:hypothetical protein